MDDGLDPQTKRLIERFKNRSTTTARVLSIWVPALVVLWLSGLEPRLNAIKTYVETNTAYLRKAELVNARKVLSTDDTVLSKVLADQSEQLKNLKNQKAYEKNQLDVPFELPGGIKIPVPVIWAPTIWIVLAFGALIFLLNQRNALTALSARVASKLTSNPDIAPLLHESLADAPFWLAPLPRKGGASATPEFHAAVLGWKNDHIWIGLCAICYIALIAIQFRVAFLGFTFVDSFGSLHERWLAPLISMIFCLASLAAASEAFIPRALADQPPLEAMGWMESRRRFIVGVVTGTLAISLSIISPRLPIIESARSPRFRLRKSNPRSEPLATQSRGLHLNQRTKVAHYILDSGQILGVSKIDVNNLIPVNFIDLKLPPNIPHAHITRASATFELTALEYVKIKDYQSACKALMTGIQYDRIFLTKVNKGPDFRLYDLLAGISVRYGLPNYLKELSTQLSIKKTDQVTVGRETALSARLKKWRDPNSKWHKKWTDKSKEIVWCALPMQDTRSAGDGRSSRPRTSPFRVSV